MKLYQPMPAGMTVDALTTLAYQQEANAPDFGTSTLDIGAPLPDASLVANPAATGVFAAIPAWVWAVGAIFGLLALRGGRW